MVEVFKTNVINHAQADVLIHQLRMAFVDYDVNFDLEDCDKILRVEYRAGYIESELIADFLKTFGCIAEILPDEADLLAG